MYYEIHNIKEFIEGSRVLIYNVFAEKKVDWTSISFDKELLTDEELEELNDCLTEKESYSIASQYIKKRRGKFVITESKYIELLEALNARITTNLLRILSNKGLLESAFDSELNDFIFWPKENNDENTETN